MKKTAALFLSLILFSPFAGENDYLKPIGRTKEAKAQRRQGGESMPPLPLPATPLRRSEKKRPPSATTLIGKVIWGGYLDYRYPDGKVQRLFDWNMAPADCQQLLRRLKETTRLEYTTKSVDLGSFSGNPAEIPILHFSGGRTIRFTDAERAKLRNYLLNGGTVWFDSIVGSPYFYKGAVEETKKILPDSPVRRIPHDHALFRLLVNTGKVKADGNREVTPEFDAVFIGSRLAVVISPRGMGAGWDGIAPVEVGNARYYDAGSSSKLGVNLAAYAIGWFENGRSFASGTDSDAGQIRSADRIVFTQIRTRGLWNPDPGAEARFMKFLASDMNIDAGAAPVYADPEKALPEDAPFLYLAGVGSFDLSENAVERLREYLKNGGCIIGNNSLGMNDFDVSFRRFVSAVCPGKKLERLKPDHPLFRKGPFRFQGSGFTEAAARKYPGSPVPLVYAVTEKDGRCSILYSPVDMAGGWLRLPRPGNVGYETDTALRLGGCMITYAATH